MKVTKKEDERRRGGKREKKQGTEALDTMLM